jgi:hypothetical protein
MTQTSINATMKKVGQMRDGQRVYTFTAVDASAANSAGAIITLPQLTRVIGDPLLTFSSVTTGAAALLPHLVSTTVAQNKITTVMNVDGSTTSVTYTGIVCGK